MLDTNFSVSASPLMRLDTAAATRYIAGSGGHQAVKPHSQIALVILSLILAHGRQLNAAEIEADLDPETAQAVLETILPAALGPALQTLFNVDAVDQLTPEQKSALLEIIKVGAAQFKADGVRYV